MRKSRLLTLSGPGGIGKTRLALKVAQDAEDEYRDGVVFVSLAPIRSNEHILQAVAEALQFPLATQENPDKQLLRYLHNKQLLLVMDNCEHLLDGIKILSDMLHSASGVTVLSTSRERLNIRGETLFPIGGMHYPQDFEIDARREYDAITLFVHSAVRVCPGFTPSADEMRQIANICQIVEGSPLAIELAAAWLYILSVDEIADELSKDLNILASESRDAPRRHRSIQAVFDHSWSLLEPAQRETFMKLSVFRGGFTRQAARQVAGATLKDLASLVAKSFLSHNPKTNRLEIHELLRQYGEQWLGDAPQHVQSGAHEAHASFFARFMQQRGECLRDSRQMQALVEIDADIENIRAAFRYDLEQNNTRQLWSYIIGLWHFHWIRWWNLAGMNLFAEAVSALHGDPDSDAAALKALAMAFQSYFMPWLDMPEQGFKLAETSIEILERHNHPQALAFAYYSLTVNAYLLKKYTVEKEAARKMRRQVENTGDRWMIAINLFALGMGELLFDDYDEAKKIAEQNLALYEEIGDRFGSTMPLIVLGHVELARKELEKARQFYLRCYKTSQDINFYYALQTSSKYLANVCTTLGKYTEAGNYLHHSLVIANEIGFTRDVVHLLYEHARIIAARGELEESIALLALVIQHPSSYYARWRAGRIRDNALELLTEIEGEIPAELFKAATRRGQKMDLDEVVNMLIYSYG